MTVDEVRKCVEEICTASETDSEEAHELEDSLYLAVLTAIAEGKCEDPVAIAKEAITSQDAFYEKFF
jgi:hypothetical protein